MREINTIQDLMKEEDLLKHVTEDIEDFDLNAVVTYAVWAIGYTKDSCVTNVDMLIGEFIDPDQAIEKAKALTLADIIHQAVEEDDGTESDESVAYISIEVETVVDDEDEGTMNIGTIYKRDIWLNEEEEQVEDSTPVIELQETDYALVEDGMLKVGCTLLKDFNKNDYVKIKFVNENTTYPFTYKIVSKVEYEDGNFFHCEFIY